MENMLLTITEIKESGEVIFTDRSIEIIKELGEKYEKTPLYRKSRAENPDWEGEANAGLLFVYMCERITEAPSRIHTIMVCKLMIPLIWEKLEQELQEKAAVADKKIEKEKSCSRAGAFKVCSSHGARRQGRPYTSPFNHQWGAEP